MHKFIFVLLLLAGCQTLDSGLKNSIKTLQRTTNPVETQHLDGKKEQEVISEFGKPMEIINFDKGTKILEYSNCFFTIEKGVVSSSSNKQNMEFEIALTAAGNLEKNTLALVSGIKGTPTDNLEFQDFIKPIKNSLIRKGYKIVEPQNDPQTLMLVKYGVTDPEVEAKDWNEPSFNNVPGAKIDSNSAEKTNVTSNRNFKRYLVAEAVDNQQLTKNKKVLQHWKLSASSVGSTENLANAISSMVAASYKYIGSSSHGQKIVSINVADPRMGLLGE